MIVHIHQVNQVIHVIASVLKDYSQSLVYIASIDDHHSFLCCSPHKLIIWNRVLTNNFELLKPITNSSEVKN